MSSDRPESNVPLAEIAHGPGAFEQFLDKNQKLLVVFAVLLVIAAAGLVVYRGVEKSRQLSAGAALFNASDLPSLRNVIEEHADTRAADSAAILLAEEQWKDGRQDDAIATLREFIDDNQDHPALASAKASLGSKLMAQGKTADATAAFQNIVDDTRSRYLDPYALVSMGDIARVAGDLEKAENLYSRARAEYPESGFASTAAGRLSSLRASLPVEVEPPPAPAEDETSGDETTAVLPDTLSTPPAGLGTPQATPDTAEIPPAQEAAPADRSENNPPTEATEATERSASTGEPSSPAIPESSNP